MYSRNFVRNGRYTPPPGYAGNTFSIREDVKHHLPENEVKRSEPNRNEKAESLCNIKIEEPRAVAPHKKNREADAFGELINSLKGRFGSEELIILAVMLLIAEDGIGFEVLILALVLIAG